MLKAGATQKAIADALGVSKSLVSTDVLSFKLPPSRRARKPPPEPLEPHVALAKELWDDHIFLDRTPAQLAEDHDLPLLRVREILNEQMAEHEEEMRTMFDGDGGAPEVLPEEKPRQGRRLDDETRERIWDLLSKGRLQKEIAEEIGCSQSTVHRVAEKLRAGQRAKEEARAAAEGPEAAARDIEPVEPVEVVEAAPAPVIEPLPDCYDALGARAYRALVVQIVEAAELRSRVLRCELADVLDVDDVADACVRYLEARDG